MGRWPVWLRVPNAIFTLLFLVGAAVQLNDPDPAQWIAIYLAAAVATVLGPLRPREGRWLAGAVACAAVLWAAGIFAGGMGPITVHELFTDLRMKTLEVERWRESLGLLIMAGWMGAVLFGTRYGRRPARQT